jgi:hypothetical protein
MGLESILHALKTGLAQPFSMVKHVIKAATVAACLTGALAGLDKLTHSYATASMDTGLITLLPALTLSTGGEIDPFTFLQSKYTWNQIFTDPANNTWGKISGADALDANTFAIIYDGGNVSLFQDSSATPYFSFPTGGSTGISWVNPAKYPGEVAVTGTDSILFYDRSGNFKEERAVQSSKIDDIIYDLEKDRIFLTTGDHGTGPLLSDGSIDYITGSAKTIQFVNLTENEAGTPIMDMLQIHSNFHHVDGVIGSFGTDLEPMIR